MKKEKVSFLMVWRITRKYIYRILLASCVAGIVIGQLLFDPPVYSLAGFIGLGVGIIISLCIFLMTKMDLKTIISSSN